MTWNEESELLRFLRHANLEMYMEAFIAKVGDDFEFEDLSGLDEKGLVEILEDIGMKSYQRGPFKKKLQEWKKMLSKFRDDLFNAKDLSALKKLLDSGADPTRVKMDDDTNVLFLMAEKDQVDMARLCIDAVKDDPGKLSNLVNNARKSDGKEIAYLQMLTK